MSGKFKSSMTPSGKCRNSPDRELEKALGHSKTPIPPYEYELIGEIKRELDSIDLEIAKNEGLLYTPSELETAGKKRSLSISNVQRTNNHIRIRELEQLIEEKDKNLKKLENKIASDQQVIGALKKLATSEEPQLAGSVKSWKRERELELSSLQRKLRESEKKTHHLKRSQYRVQDLNNQLVERIQNLEGSKENTADQQFKTQVKELQGIKKILNRENNYLRQEITKVNKKLRKVKGKYKEFIGKSTVFEEKTRELYRANKLLHDSLATLISEAI